MYIYFLPPLYLSISNVVGYTQKGGVLVVVEGCWVGGEIGGTASNSQNKPTEKMLIVKKNS